MASKADYWQGNVILAHAELAIAEKRWEEAMAEVDRYDERYGVNEQTLVRRARILQATGRLDDARRLLEQRYREFPTQRGISDPLVRIYLEQDARAELEAFLQFLRRHPARTRVAVLRHVDMIRAKYPDLADQLLADLGPSIAGPLNLSEIAAWKPNVFPIPAR